MSLLPEFGRPVGRGLERCPPSHGLNKVVASEFGLGRDPDSESGSRPRVVVTEAVASARRPHLEKPFDEGEMRPAAAGTGMAD